MARGHRPPCCSELYLIPFFQEPGRCRSQLNNLDGDMTSDNRDSLERSLWNLASFGQRVFLRSWSVRLDERPNWRRRIKRMGSGNYMTLLGSDTAERFWMSGGWLCGAGPG